LIDKIISKFPYKSKVIINSKQTLEVVEREVRDRTHLQTNSKAEIIPNNLNLKEELN